MVCLKHIVERDNTWQPEVCPISICIFIPELILLSFTIHSNLTSFFRFANKRASYPFGILSLAHAPVNVTDFSIGIINCVRHFPQT